MPVEDTIMGTEFPGFGGPSASTEAPLEMLAACHLRIERQCATLGRLVAHVSEHGADPEARQAAERVLKYFDTAAIQHHADEVVDLFPALIESMAGSDAVCIHEMTEGLTAEHRELEAGWRRLRVPLKQIAAGQPGSLDGEEVTGFVDLYRRHLAREDQELLPMAQRLLSDAELATVGRAMRERRGIPEV
jgi:hemerythrin-like domain-containing protein